jgi:hypothetical protein
MSQVFDSKVFDVLRRVTTATVTTTAMQPSGTASIAAWVEIGLPQLSGVH